MIEEKSLLNALLHEFVIRAHDLIDCIESLREVFKEEGIEMVVGEKVPLEGCDENPLMSLLSLDDIESTLLDPLHAAVSPEGLIVDEKHCTECKKENKETL